MQTIRQGHPYLYNGAKVIALETTQSTYAKVLLFNEKQPWLGDLVRVHTGMLVPQPLRYLHGQLPNSPK